MALLKTAWTFTAHGAFNSSPVVAGGTVFVTPSDNSIDALNAATGALRWSQDFYNQQYSTPAVVNGTVYVGASVEGKLYAFSAKTGTEKWFFQTGDRVQAAATSSEGPVINRPLRSRSAWVQAPSGARLGLRAICPLRGPRCPRCCPYGGA